MNEKVIIIVPGKLAFYSEENYKRIKKVFNNNVEFFIIGWENNDKNEIEKFKEIYHPAHISSIPNQNFENILKEIKYPDYAGSTLGALHMWKSIYLSFKEVSNFFIDKPNKPHYVLRYRSDILPKLNSEFLKKNLNNKEILIPDRYHWNGINDQIFLFKYNDLILFDEIDEFIKKHIKNNRFFCSEYIFQQFLKKQKIKIKFSQFDYNIMRFKNQKKPFKYMRTEKPIIDWFNCKINKLNYRLRNFNEHYIKKSHRNKNQDIEI